MSRTPDQRDQRTDRKPALTPGKPAPTPGGQPAPKPGDWVNALLKQIRERRA